MLSVANPSSENFMEKIEESDIILDERNHSTEHVVVVESFTQRGSFGPPVLWLDGGNSFNPYRISELGRELGLNSEEILKNIYISRAFTCYQIMSLIFERLNGAIDSFDPDLIVITGLPGLFTESDLPSEEALRAFDSTIDELEDFQGADRTVFMVSTDGREDSEFNSKLESISDHTIKTDSNRENPKKTGFISPGNAGRTPTDTESSPRPLTLEEF